MFQFTSMKNPAYTWRQTWYPFYRRKALNLWFELPSEDHDGKSCLSMVLAHDTGDIALGLGLRYVLSNIYICILGAKHLYWDPKPVLNGPGLRHKGTGHKHWGLELGCRGPRHMHQVTVSILTDPSLGVGDLGTSTVVLGLDLDGRGLEHRRSGHEH